MNKLGLLVVAALVLAGCREDLSWTVPDATAAPDVEFVRLDAGANSADAEGSGSPDAEFREDAATLGEDVGSVVGDDAGPAGDAGDAGSASPADASVADAGAQPDAQSVAPFEMLTSGGARVSTTQHRLDVFVAPTVPVGAVETSKYRVNLGPGPISNKH